MRSIIATIYLGFTMAVVFVLLITIAGLCCVYEWIADES